MSIQYVHLLTTPPACLDAIDVCVFNDVTQYLLAGAVQVKTILSQHMQDHAVAWLSGYPV